MKFIVLPVFALAAFGLAHPSQAREQPVPKPSGQVFHLFGPDSVLSNVLPVTPSQPATTAAAPNAPGATSASQPAAQATTYAQPGWGDVLHQMFVTGDPNRKPGDALAKGKTARGLGD